MAFNNFEKIKKKYFKVALIAGIILGICCGVALACVIAVILKRCAVNLHWAVYIPIGAAISAGLSVAFFFILRPTDVKIAKKLDSDLALNQKVQTMVEFSSSQSAMHTLQREQTEAALETATKKRVDLKWLLKFLFIPVLAVAMLFAGIFVPAKKATSSDPPFNVTENQIMLLNKLIEEVQSSELQEDIKTPSVTTLNSLLEGLRLEQPQSVMKAAVISSVKIIDNLVANVNSYQKLYNSLKERTELTSFASAVANAATFYKAGGSQINTMAAVKAKFLTSDEQIENSLLIWQSAFLIDFEADGDDNGEGETSFIPVSEAAQKLSDYSAAIAARLKETPYYNQTENADALYSAIEKFGNDFKTLSENTKNVGDSAYNGKISETCSNFITQAQSPLMLQSYNLMMDEFIRNTLASIFRINRTEFGDSAAVTVPETGSGNDDPNGNHSSGGYGKGDLIYGSNDVILNVEYDGTDGSKKQVPYGEVLEKYNDIVSDLISEEAFPKDIAAYLEQYFRLLYSGIEKEEE